MEIPGSPEGFRWIPMDSDGFRWIWMVNWTLGWWEGPPMNCCEAWMATMEPSQGTLSHLDVGEKPLNAFVFFAWASLDGTLPFRSQIFAQRLLILRAQGAQKVPQLLLAPSCSISILCLVCFWIPILSMTPSPPPQHHYT